jgi:hypothetical protein
MEMGEHRRDFGLVRYSTTKPILIRQSVAGDGAGGAASLISASAAAVLLMHAGGKVPKRVGQCSLNAFPARPNGCATRAYGS